MSESAVLKPHATFPSMKESTAEDWGIIKGEFVHFSAALPDRVLTHLKLLECDYGGFPVDRFRHSLLTATLAHQAGENEEYVVCALLHDIGDTLGCFNHPDIAAAILKPFVAEENHWMVEKHGVFQGYYFFQYLGLDRDMREHFKGHPHYERTRVFCEKYDNPAFNVNLEAMPLSAFEPMVRRLFSVPKRSIYLTGNGA